MIIFDNNMPYFDSLDLYKRDYIIITFLLLMLFQKVNFDKDYQIFLSK